MTPRAGCGALSFLSPPLGVRPPRCGHTPRLALGVSSGSFPASPAGRDPVHSPSSSTSPQSRPLLASPSDVRLSLGCALGRAGDGRAAGGSRRAACLRPPVLERGEGSVNVLQPASQWRLGALWAARCLSLLFLPALVWPMGAICKNRRLAQFGPWSLAKTCSKESVPVRVKGSSDPPCWLIPECVSESAAGASADLSPPRPSDSVVLTFLQPS